MLRVCRSRLLGAVGRRLLAGRSWIVENGVAAGMKLRFPQNQDFISGNSELPVQEAVRKHLKAGDVFYDIGANIGFFSLLAAKIVGRSGKVFAFEPVPQNAATIRHNADLNNLEYLRVFELAIGERSAEQDLFVTEWDGGSSLLSSALRPDEQARKQKVRVAPLDDLISQEKIAPPSFIKLDVEGAELEALRGMTKTLKEHLPVLLFEVDDGDPERFKLRHKQLDEFVSNLGYTLSHLPAAYANTQWTVGHSLCLPRSA